MQVKAEKAFSFSLNNLDLVRLFAAIQVVLTHAFTHLHTNATWQKWMGVLPGVPIFFFISGFLIYRSYVKSESIKNFFLNRFLRIYPALWVCLFLSVLSLFLVGYLSLAHIAVPSFWVWILAQSTFFQFFNPEFLRGFGVGALNGSLWTISLELQFYVLTPIVFWIVSKHRILFPILLSLFLLANAIKDVMPFHGVLLKCYMVTFVPWFGMFLLGAWLSTRLDVVQSILRIRLLYIIALLGAADYVCYQFGLVIGGNEINAISFVFLVLLILKVSYTKPDLSRQLLHNNDISYGVYIYHMPIINLMIFLGLLGGLQWVFVVVVLVCVMAALSWFLVEKPVLSLKKRTIRLIDGV